MGIALTRFQLAQPWLESGALVRLGSGACYRANIPSPHAHYLCWRTGMMERWECVAFSDWLKQSIT